MIKHRRKRVNPWLYLLSWTMIFSVSLSTSSAPSPASMLSSPPGPRNVPHMQLPFLLRCITVSFSLSSCSCMSCCILLRVRRFISLAFFSFIWRYVSFNLGMCHLHVYSGSAIGDMDRYNVGLMQEYRHCEGGRRRGCGENNKATLTVMERAWEQVTDSVRLGDR